MQNYHTRRFLSSLAMIFLSAIAFATPSFASSSMPNFERTAQEAFFDNPVFHLSDIYVIESDGDLRALAHREKRNSWRTEQDLVSVNYKQAIKRQGLSYRVNRQPHVKGAPVVI